MGKQHTDLHSGGKGRGNLARPESRGKNLPKRETDTVEGRASLPSCHRASCQVLSAPIKRPERAATLRYANSHPTQIPRNGTAGKPETYKYRPKLSRIESFRYLSWYMITDNMISMTSVPRFRVAYLAQHSFEIFGRRVNKSGHLLSLGRHTFLGLLAKIKCSICSDQYNC